MDRYLSGNINLQKVYQIVPLFDFTLLQNPDKANVLMASPTLDIYGGAKIYQIN